MTRTSRKGWWLGLAPVIVVLLSYLSAPLWLPILLSTQLPQGLSLVSLRLSHPTLSGWHIQHLELSSHDFGLTLHDVYLTWEAKPEFVIKRLALFVRAPAVPASTSESQPQPIHWPTTLPWWPEGRIKDFQVTTAFGQWQGTTDVHAQKIQLSGCWRMPSQQHCGRVQVLLNEARNRASLSWAFHQLSHGHAQLSLGKTPRLNLSAHLSTIIDHVPVRADAGLTAIIESKMSQSRAYGHFSVNHGEFQTTIGRSASNEIHGTFMLQWPDWHLAIKPSQPFVFHTNEHGPIKLTMPNLWVDGQKEGFVLALERPWKISTQLAQTEIDWPQSLTCSAKLRCLSRMRITALGSLDNLLPAQQARGEWQAHADVQTTLSPTGINVQIRTPIVSLKDGSFGPYLSIPSLKLTLEDSQLTWVPNADIVLPPVHYTAEGNIAILDKSTQLTARGKITQANHILNGQLAMGSEALLWRLDTKLSDFSTDITLKGDHLTIPRWWPTIDSNLMWDAGTMDVQWSAHIEPKKLPESSSQHAWLAWFSRATKAKSHVTISEFYGRFKKMGWQNVFAKMELDEQRKWDLALSAANMQAAAGYAIAKLQWQGQLDDTGQLYAGPIQGTLFQGQLASRPFAVDLFKPIDKWHLANQVVIKDLSLEALSSSLKFNGLKAKGVVDLTAPFRWAHGKFSIQNGQINGKGPGIIQYRKGLSSTNIAFAALENFHYSSLSGQLSYEPNGHYQIKLRIVGTNPDMPNLGGVPIAFNPTIQGQLPSMFWSVFVTGDFEQDILKGMHIGK